jgi:hypothetical protein
MSRQWETCAAPGVHLQSMYRLSIGRSLSQEPAIKSRSRGDARPTRRARRRHRERMKSPEAQAAYSRRQHFGETPFAVIKTSFDMRRFLLRGVEGVGQEWRWASTAFNLRKLMSFTLRGQSRQLQLQD